MKNIAFALILSSIIWQSCCNKQDSPNINSTKSILTTIADTIRYDVTIQPPLSADQYQKANLKYLNKTKLVNQLFEAVYNHSAKAYNYYTNKELSITEIQDIEEQYPRELVGRLQFTETWYYNPEKLNFQKEVHSILIAYERIEENGDVKYYKAGFIIKLH